MTNSILTVRSIVPYFGDIYLQQHLSTKRETVTTAGMIFIHVILKVTIMKKISLIIASLMTISFLTLAQDKDSANAEKGSSEINRNNQSDSKRPTDDESGQRNQNNNQNSNSKGSQDSSDSSPTNQSSSVPAGENGILDGTNAIPVDSSKESGKDLKGDNNKRPKKKNEK
jgi:hypothetical protein